MEVIEKTPDPASLRKMRYSDLKKLAKKHGIKSNMKAEKIIAAISSLDSSGTDSFSTPAQELINSSKKNKEEMFDEDNITPLATPRRGTYSLDDASLKVDDEPVLIDTSALDTSNVTFSRGSERKLRPRKVSFVSPMMMPSTPKNQSLRLRPKTPIASRTSVGQKVSFSATPASQQKMKSREKSLPVTPLPKFTLSNESSEKSDAVTPLPSITEASGKEASTPSVKLPQEDVIESSSVKSLVKSVSSAKIKRFATPNFKQIHQRAFEKMESIDDYQKRKVMNSEKKIGLHPSLRSKVTKAKSKIPNFSGIPFIPSIWRPESIKTDQNAKNKNNAASVGVSSITKIVKENASPKKKKIVKDNASQKKRKFDLKASLSRKLSYTPYKGPLKPLAESNNVNSSSAKKPTQKKTEAPINKVVNDNRLKTRSVLRGVRTNKRFELQMKNRKL